MCVISTNINGKKIWLDYFNKVLSEKGLINDDERNKMKLLIVKNYRTHGMDNE